MISLRSLICSCHAYCYLCQHSFQHSRLWLRLETRSAAPAFKGNGKADIVLMKIDLVMEPRLTNSPGDFLWLLTLCFSNLEGCTDGKVTQSSPADTGSGYWQFPHCLASLWDLFTLCLADLALLACLLSAGKAVLERCWWASFIGLPVLLSSRQHIQPPILQETPNTAQTGASFHVPLAHLTTASSLRSSDQGQRRKQSCYLLIRTKSLSWFYHPIKLLWVRQERTNSFSGPQRYTNLRVSRYTYRCLMTRLIYLISEKGCFWG